MVTSHPDEVQNAITSVCQQFVEFFNSGDTEALASLYSEDAKILPPNMDILEGRSMIQAVWQGAIDKGIKSFKSEPIEMESSGNLAFFVGKYKLYGSENQEISHGKYISVFKNIDGKWKVHRDIFNRSTPLEEK
jgi:uncharacterized protein (TIGR02246 family)